MLEHQEGVVRFSTNSGVICLPVARWELIRKVITAICRETPSAEIGDAEGLPWLVLLSAEDRRRCIADLSNGLVRALHGGDFDYLESVVEFWRYRELR